MESNGEPVEALLREALRRVGHRPGSGARVGPREGSVR